MYLGSNILGQGKTASYKICKIISRYGVCNCSTWEVEYKSFLHFKLQAPEHIWDCVSEN